MHNNALLSRLLPSAARFVVGSSSHLESSLSVYLNGSSVYVFMQDSRGKTSPLSFLTDDTRVGVVLLSRLPGTCTL